MVATARPTRKEPKVLTSRLEGSRGRPTGPVPVPALQSEGWRTAQPPAVPGRRPLLALVASRPAGCWSAPTALVSQTEAHHRHNELNAAGKADARALRDLFGGWLGGRCAVLLRRSRPSLKPGRWRIHRDRRPRRIPRGHPTTTRRSHAFGAVALASWRLAASCSPCPAVRSLAVGCHRSSGETTTTGQCACRTQGRATGPMACGGCPGWGAGRVVPSTSISACAARSSNTRAGGSFATSAVSCSGGRYRRASSVAAATSA